jgi:iron complex transport system permease protein
MTRTAGIAIGLTAVLLIVAVVAGPGNIGVGEALRLLGDGFAGRLEAGAASVTVWELRFPRALLAALLGAALAASGALTQGLFRNPMAEPGVLGISSGAAAFAVVGIYFELDRAALWSIPVIAGVGATVTLILLFALSGRASRSTLLLSGIAVSAFFAAFVSLVMSMQQTRWDLGVKVIGWLMGSFEGRGWPHLYAALIPCGIGFAIAMWLRADLDALHLGDETATSLGVDLSRTRMLAIIGIAILVGTATAIPGVIGFVGLIVPHVARMFVGPGHRQLLPTSMALGALVLLSVDTASRTILPADPPPGVITSFLGAPFFLWLLKHKGGLR